VFLVPTTQSPGSFVLLARVDATNVLLESSGSNNFAAAPAAFTVTSSFGNVGGHSGVAFHTTDSGGTAGVFRLLGPGTGTVTNDATGISVTLSGTTDASRFIVTVPGTDDNKSAGIALRDVSADGPIGAMLASAVTITQSLTLAGGAGTVTVSGLNGATVRIGAAGALLPSLSLGSVMNSSLTADGQVRSIVVASWEDSADAQVSAASIGVLLCRGAFTPSLSVGVTSAPPRGLAANLLSVGSSSSSTWNLRGSVNRIVANGDFATGVTSIGGSLGLLSAGSLDFVTLAAAADMRSLLVRGNMSGSVVMAGADFGPDGQHDGVNDTFGVARISLLRVVGTVTGSTVVAGGVPQNDGSYNLLSGGQIAGLVLGGCDDASRFLAATPPRHAIIDGVVVPPDDPRFHQ
jgi:hypothetical protein